MKTIISTLKNRNGFGLTGLIVAMVVIGIMSAMLVPTFTANMNYKQAKYAVGVIRTIENAENAYMAKNNGNFATLTTLSSGGYLSSNFLQSVQGGSYPQPNWVNIKIANQAGSACIDNGSGCPNNPGVGSNGYFIGIYGIPTQFQTYIEHEIPGSGANGTQDVSYVAPIPSSPPVANAQNANYANSAGSAQNANYANTAGSAQNANYANTAGYANSSGLPAWSQEASSLVGTWYYGTSGGYYYYNTTGNTLLVEDYMCGTLENDIIPSGGVMPPQTTEAWVGCVTIGGSEGAFVLSAYSG